MNENDKKFILTECIVNVIYCGIQVVHDTKIKIKAKDMMDL
jgi:hypothetical protein